MKLVHACVMCLGIVTFSFLTVTTSTAQQNVINTEQQEESAQTSEDQESSNVLDPRFELETAKTDEQEEAPDADQSFDQQPESHRA
jgi:hypothetical protein